jgi:hypothetical protein
MKALLIPALVGFVNIVFGQQFELRLEKSGTDKFAVQMRETAGSAPRSGDQLTDLVFGICWDKNYDISLGEVQGAYTIQKAGPEGSMGALAFQQFAKSSTPISFPGNWSANQWVTILEVANSKTSMLPNGTFQVCPTSIQELNININLNDYRVKPAGNVEGVQIGYPQSNTLKRKAGLVDTSASNALDRSVASTALRNDWSVNPNPGNGIFVLTVDAELEEEDLQVTVTDATGQLIYQDVISVQAGSNQHTIDLRRAASSGAYQLSLHYRTGDVRTKNLIITP